VKIFLIIQIMIMAGCIEPQANRFEALRQRMVKTQIQDRGVNSAAVLDAMRKVPRHLFIPKEYQDEAYNDYPLPIGYGQTISQPFIVAYMTEVLRPGKKMKALEIGTGSGYQAAILAEIVDKVYTIEIVPDLAVESAVVGTHGARLGELDIGETWYDAVRDGYRTPALVVAGAGCNGDAQSPPGPQRLVFRNDVGVAQGHSMGRH